jgi:hypothetical protein
VKVDPNIFPAVLFGINPWYFGIWNSLFCTGTYTHQSHQSAYLGRHIMRGGSVHILIGPACKISGSEWSLFGGALVVKLALGFEEHCQIKLNIVNKFQNECSQDE